MPRKKTARKQGEKFVSKVSDEMVEDRFMELYPAQVWQEIFVESPEYKSRLLAYIRVVMELEEISHEIEDIRAKQGIQASLVNIGPRGGRTLTPLQQSRRTKVNQVLRNYQSIRKSTEWIIPRGMDWVSLPIGSDKGMRSTSSHATRRKAAKEKAIKKGPSSSRVARNEPKMKGEAKPAKGSAPREPKSTTPTRDPIGGNQKRPSVTEQDIANTIMELKKGPKRKTLLPEEILIFRTMLGELKSREKDWKALLKIAKNAKIILDLKEEIIAMIEFLKSLL